MDRFRKIRGYIEDGLNLTARLVQNGEDHPQCLCERGGGVLVVFGEAGQAAIPRWPPPPREPPPRNRDEESSRNQKEQKRNRNDRSGYQTAMRRSRGKHPSVRGDQIRADSWSE